MMPAVQQAMAQHIEQGYYMFPIKPGEVNYLAGTMGELRAAHFHAGIDIKTGGVSGLKVYAAADGYVSRARVSPSGYGNALYIAHPNGTTTVYAHLQDFEPEIAAHVRAAQYQRESFSVDIATPKNKFKVKRGQVIALSGNSGSSSGPHLHFEIRNASQEVLDPLSYGFSEIKDTREPVLSQLAFVTMDENSTVNGMFGRFDFSVIWKDGRYQLEVPVQIKGRIGVEVYAYDKLNGASNRNGIVKQTLLLDGERIFHQMIETITFGESRSILAHINYKRMKEGGRRFNKLYVGDGNLLKFYQTGADKGILTISDSLSHTLSVALEDSYGNTRQYNIDVNDKKYTLSTKNKNMYALNKRGYDLRAEVLEIKADNVNKECLARVFVNEEEKLFAHRTLLGSTGYYLWNVRQGFPDSVSICGRSYVFNYRKMIPSASTAVFSDENIHLDFGKDALFDTLYLCYQKEVNREKTAEYFNFPHDDQPLRKYVTLTLKPELNYDREHAFVYAKVAKAVYFVGGKWNADGITFNTRELVNYTIESDTAAPEIYHLKSRPKQLKFKIRDKKSGIGSFRAELNGEWLLMNYDAKTGYLSSDPKKELNGKFTLTVSDNSGNKKVWSRTLVQ